MKRRTFFGGVVAGLVGFLFSKETSARPGVVTHELLDHGLSHEEMAQRVVDLPKGYAALDAGRNIASLILAGEASRTGSTVVAAPSWCGSSLRVSAAKRSYPLSEPGWRTVYFSHDNTFFGCIGERWFRLG